MPELPYSLYTNNKTTAAAGTLDVLNISVGTDTGLAMSLDALSRKDKSANNSLRSCAR